MPSGDDRMDARLRAAGQRWGAREDTDVTVSPAAPGGTRPESPRRHGRRWVRWAAPVAAAAAVAGVVSGIYLTGTGTGAGPRTPVNGPAAPTGGAGWSALTGHGWSLTGIETAAGGRVRVVKPASFEISGPRGSAQMTMSDGCASSGSSVTIGSGSLRFGQVALAAVACTDDPPGLDQQRRSIDSFLLASTPIRWSLTGDTLTLARRGGVTLTYTRSSSAVGTSPSPAIPSATTSTGPTPTAVVTGYKVVATPMLTHGTSGPVALRVSPAEAVRLARLVAALPSGQSPRCVEASVLVYRIELGQGSARRIVAGYECAAAVSITGADGHVVWHRDASCSLDHEIRRIVPASATGTRTATIGCR